MFRFNSFSRKGEKIALKSRKEYKKEKGKKILKSGGLELI